MSAPPSSKAAQSIAAFQDGAYLARVRKLQAGTSTAKTGHWHFRDCTLTGHPRDTSKSTRLTQLRHWPRPMDLPPKPVRPLSHYSIKPIGCRLLSAEWT